MARHLDWVILRPSVILGRAAYGGSAPVPWSCNPTAALWESIIISVFNAAIGTWIVPRLWMDPLGPMLKIWPVLMLNAVALANSR